MHNCYIQKLLTIENLHKLIDSEQYGASLYNAIYFWDSAILVPDLSRNSRFFLLQTAFLNILKFYTLQDLINRKFNLGNSDNNRCMLCSKNFMIRCLNSAIAAIYCLITFPNIGLDRLENQDDEIIDLTDIN
ncbi:hypothetical protein M9Y10_029708 [Tritrichomonas musculus]|uniref:Uncharacterized protein n=1 Tax=Tritrichomonas musculus TaxID=1915356 RepID=A0ABR2KMW1_9EUKA